MRLQLDVLFYTLTKIVESLNQSGESIIRYLLNKQGRQNMCPNGFSLSIHGGKGKKLIEHVEQVYPCMFQLVLPECTHLIKCGCSVIESHDLSLTLSQSSQ